MDALRSLWEYLLRRQSHSLFQRFSWNRLAARAFSDRLAPYVVCVQNDNGAAIIPAAVSSRDDRIELLGELLFDYRDVLHAGDPEVLRIAWGEVAKQNRSLHVLSLEDAAGRLRWNDFERMPFTTAPEVREISEEAFRLAHSRLGRQVRRLYKQGVRLNLSSGDDAQTLRHLYECKRTHFAADQSDNVFLDSQRCQFMVAAAALEGSSCEVYTLAKDATLIAGLVTFRDAAVRRFYTIYFNPAWARYSPGQALLFEITARSLAEGLACDYMTGEYPYKLRLANARRPLFRIDHDAAQLSAIARRPPAASAA